MSKQSVSRPDPATFAAMIKKELTGGYRKAAELYGRYVTMGGDLQALHRCSDFAPTLWRELDGLYRGTLDPRTILLHYLSKQTLMAMPLKQQEQLHDKGVILADASGFTKTLKLTELAPRQLLQVFDGPRIRDVEQQVSWLANNHAAATGLHKRKPRASTETGKPVRKFELDKVKREVRVYNDPTVPYVTLTLAELTAMVAKLTQ